MLIYLEHAIRITSHLNTNALHAVAVEMLETDDGAIRDSGNIANRGVTIAAILRDSRQPWYAGHHMINLRKLNSRPFSNL